MGVHIIVEIPIKSPQNIVCYCHGTKILINIYTTAKESQFHTLILTNLRHLKFESSAHLPNSFSLLVMGGPLDGSIEGPTMRGKFQHVTSFSDSNFLSLHTLVYAICL